MDVSSAADSSSTAEAELSRAISQRNATRRLPRPPALRNDSADRKRRLTSPDQGRSYSYNPPGHRTSNAALGSRVREDLAARVLPHFREHSGPTMADLVPEVPQWQPDEDVQKCPICETEFTIFFRKHHCRKCGRVVCGECSRHRITMPVKYIAQPPWAVESGLQNHGGSSAVRVCNPCVPDPWSPPNNARQAQDAGSRAFNRYSLPPPPPPPTNTLAGLHRHSADLSQPPPYSIRPDPRMSLQPPAIPSRRPVPQGVSEGHLRTQSLDQTIRSRPAIPTQFTRPLPPTPPPPPRREVKEEDECPVCGIELAPGDVVREAHIADCVMTRFGSPGTARPVPADTDAETPAASSSSPTNNRFRAQSYRSRGLYQYKATEKDCVDGEGQEQECPICFEEFEAGETLGRLECLCRFHHKCIREWWARKGPGMCPVHASHE